jgi:MucB/RseB family protein
VTTAPWRAPQDGGQGLRRAVLVVALLAAAATLLPTTSAAGGAAWRLILERAAANAAVVPYAGEALWVTWTPDGEAQVTTLEVRNSSSGRLTMAAPTRYSLTVDNDGSRFVDHRGGWLLPLPGTGQTDPGPDLDLLERKYEILLRGVDELLDRPCVRVEISRRRDGTLRERLWFDQASGLLLRRETFDGQDRRVRLATYLSLDLHPDTGGSSTSTYGPRPLPPGDVQRRDQGVVPVAAHRYQALREAGWLLPARLPGGYELGGAYAMSSLDGQPLQLFYTDGLYAASVFEQRGALDAESLPAGAQVVEELDQRTYEWPGAAPQRIVWEAQGSTFSLVGDAPRDELLAIAASLPRPTAPPLPERLRRGFRTLWSWVSR